ncbi:MAG TPA: hypothetical protein VEI07_19135 [Planctomycetaceae bacterium]|nr:hypothetical protein [Planctomycetaceae bacterium]
MTTSSRPLPLVLTQALPARPICPVCGTTSYSRRGIHPQCAQLQADDRRMSKLKAVKRQTESKVKASNPLALRPWHKRCPKCRAELHIRKTTCECGHRFATMRNG